MGVVRVMYVAERMLNSTLCMDERVLIYVASHGK